METEKKVKTEKKKKSVFEEIGGAALAVGAAVVAILAGTQTKNPNGQNNA